MKTPLFILTGVLTLVCIYYTQAKSYASCPPAVQKELPVLQSLTVEDGLPEGFVNGILQDKEGFIWMGTRDGLVRYDGYNVKVFKHHAADDSGTIASNTILSLFPDKENNLWIIYSHAIDIFNTITHSVQHISKNPSFDWLTKGTGSSDITLLEDASMRYWAVAPNREALGYFTLDHLAPRKIPIPVNEKIVTLKEGRKGKLWVFTNRALYIVRNDTLKEVASLPESLHFEYYRNNRVVQDGQGNWVIGATGMVAIFNIHHKSWTLIPTPYFSHTKLLTKGPQGKIYFNVGNKVFRLNQDHSLTALWTNTDTPGDLQALMIDHSRVMWIGTDTFGARLINLSSRGFHTHEYRYGFIYDILSQYNFRFDRDSYQKNIISYLFRSALDKRGNLWFINLFSPYSNKPAPPGYLPVYRLKDNKLSKKFIKTTYSGFLQISFDHQNHCWALLEGKDSLHCILAKVDLYADTLSTVKQFSRPVSQLAYLTTFHQKLCIVYKDELQLYDPRTGESTFYKHQFGNARLLMATPDLSDDSILWLTGLGNGLMKLNVVTGSSHAFTTKEGIPNNTVYAALRDEEGNLWCSSNKGIFRFNTTDHHVISFTAKDGLQGNEFNRYHFLQMADGKLFFGGPEGWDWFYPDSVHIDYYQPNTVITGITINTVPIKNLPKWQDSTITTLRTITLSHNQNFIAFSFSGLQFNNAGTMPYRYQLVGLDSGWIRIHNQHIANYTSLPPGNYTFKVNAGNSAGIWSPDIKTIQVIILPPWWKSWWAYVLYIIITLAACYVFYRYRTARWRISHEMILKEKETDHLKQLDEMKTRFFSNITHEFRTPLSLIIGPLEQINQECEVRPFIKEKISGVQRNAQQLLRLINQLLDMSKIETNNMKINLSRGKLDRFLMENIQLFRSQIEVKGINLAVKDDVEGVFLFDADKWQKIIFNLISNALKFTNEGGHICIHLTEAAEAQETHLICLSIEDSGIGIKKDQLPFVFDRFYQADDSLKAQGSTGIGLALTKELTELMGGKIAVESEVGKGTIFRLAIPVKNAAGRSVPAAQKVREDIPPVLKEDKREQEEKRDEEKTTPGKDASLILIVEDNEELNHFISQTVGKSYRIMSSCNGKEALRMANEHLPDLIISDIIMSEMDGYLLCQKIKQAPLTNHIAVILLSARSSHESVIKGLENQADDYMTKPFHPDELLLRVHNLLDRQKKLRNYYQDQLADLEQKVEPANIKNPFLIQLYQLIEDNLDNKVMSIELLAKKMNMSHRTLNRKLEMITGLSAAKLIRQYRLKKAVTLLESGYNVSETAYTTGFDTPSYFSVSFKQFYGVSPSEYRMKKNYYRRIRSSN